jgi:5'-3' exonuclease
MGFFYRTIRIVENGIKPAYVFDGKPPDLKSGVVSTAFPTLPVHNSESHASWRSVSRSVKRPRRKERRLKRLVGPLLAACSFRQLTLGRHHGGHRTFDPTNSQGHSAA